jgi:hypothetical protein
MPHHCENCNASTIYLGAMCRECKRFICSLCIAPKHSDEEINLCIPCDLIWKMEGK